MKGKSRIVKKKFISSSIALILLLALTAQASFGQRTRRASSTAASPAMAATTPLSALPASDAVMLIDIKRVINEVVPRVITDPAQLLKMNAHFDLLKTRYGLDVRSFEQLAVGLRFQSPREGVTTTDLVAIASGTFNSGALLAATRIAAKGKYQEQPYKNSTIYIFEVNDQVNIPGMSNMKVKQLAVAALGANSLVFGEPDGVRATLDGAQRRGGRINTELIQLAMRNPNAFVSFGANIPASATQGKDFGNDEINKNISSIKQAYGALGLTPTGFDLMAIARTDRAEQARSLGDTLSALKQFGGMFVSQLPPGKGKLAQAALDNLTITTEGNETQVKLALAQAVINELMRNL
jgi:hypothetical protein